MKPIKITQWVIIGVIMLNFINCDATDVSHTNQYKDHIGKEYETIKEMYIFKLNSNDGGNKFGESYSINISGLGGTSRRYLSKEILPISATLRIEKIIKFPYNIFRSDYLIVQISSTNKYNDALVHISDFAILKNLELSPEYFKEIPSFPMSTLGMHTIERQPMPKLNKTPTTLSMNSQLGSLA